jgi:hypothetical protein
MAFSGSAGSSFQSYDDGSSGGRDAFFLSGNSGRSSTVSSTSSTSGNVTTQITVTENIKQIASNELVSIDIIPFIRAQKIYFRATGLRPSCRHFAFFDRKPVDVWCRQENYETISNDPTEYGNQYNNATEHPEGTTELFSNSNGVLEGSFFLPNTDAISFRTGEREFRLVDISIYDLDTAISTAFAIFTANGLLENRRDVYLKTTTILTTRTTTTYVTRNSYSGGGGGNGGGPTSYRGSKGRTFASRQAAIQDGGPGTEVNQRANTKNSDAAGRISGPDNTKPGGGGGGGNNESCFVAGTMIKMADGTQKAIEDIDLNDEVKEGGIVWGIGQFMADDIHDYEGVQVSGSHLVKEDGLWTRVRDSKKGILLDNKEPTRVYVFACENHVLETYNGVIFSDFFETESSNLLVQYQEDFMDYWRNGRTVDKPENDARKDILNNEH